MNIYNNLLLPINYWLRRKLFFSQKVKQFGREKSTIAWGIFSGKGKPRFSFRGSTCTGITLKRTIQFNMIYINPFVPNAPFLYPLKISENLTVFWCFQEVEKGWMGNKWVNTKQASLTYCVFLDIVSVFRRYNSS